MPRNVELKLRLRGVDEYQRVYSLATQLSTSQSESFGQTDMYFPVHNPDAVRMKLRTQTQHGVSMGSELIIYSRPDTAEARVSDYTRLQTVSTPANVALLQQAFGQYEVVVTKTRALFISEHVRIHLDFVDGAGYFLEFEAVLDEDTHNDEQRDGHQCIARLCERLGVTDAVREPRGYREILLSP